LFIFFLIIHDILNYKFDVRSFLGFFIFIINKKKFDCMDFHYYSIGWHGRWFKRHPQISNNKIFQIIQFLVRFIAWEVQEKLYMQRSDLPFKDIVDKWKIRQKESRFSQIIYQFSLVFWKWCPIISRIQVKMGIIALLYIHVNCDKMPTRDKRQSIFKTNLLILNHLNKHRKE